MSGFRTKVRLCGGAATNSGVVKDCCLEYLNVADASLVRQHIRQRYWVVDVRTRLVVLAALVPVPFGCECDGFDQACQITIHQEHFSSSRSSTADS